MEHKHPTPARPDIAADPVSAPPVGPLIPASSADIGADDQAIALPEPEPSFSKLRYAQHPGSVSPHHRRLVGWFGKKGVF